MRIHAHHYASGQLIEVACSEGIISSVTDPISKSPEIRADWIAPAWFDLQINGCDGISFNSPKLTRDGIERVVNRCRQHGIGSFAPTLITNSFIALHHGFSTLAKACDASPELSRAIPVFHLEGPYISAEDGPRGAHPRQHVRNPDWEEFSRWQTAAGGRIRLVTLAPEKDGALPFIEKLTASGVVVSIGHTAASPANIRDAIRAGAKLSTHLGNGSHAMLPRHENYLWEQLAADELVASLICDGHHLPASVVRCFVRVKSPSRLILTCDASSLAGLPPGRYQEWEQEIEIRPEGKIVVLDSGFLAGSWAFTDVCIANAMRFAGLSLQDAVDMAGAHPRQLLGLPERRVEVGFPADLVAFDWEPGGEIRIVETVTS